MSIDERVPADYLDYTDRDDLLGGGVKLVPVQTRKVPSGKRVSAVSGGTRAQLRCL